MAQSNLKYIKSVRTRFYNTLDREIQIGKRLLESCQQDIDTSERKNLLKEVNECKLKINTYVEKLDSQSEKLASALGDSDNDLTEKILDEDSGITEQALSVASKLQLSYDEIYELESLSKPEKSVFESEFSVRAFENMCDYQMKMQQEFFKHQDERSESYMELQREFLRSHRDSTRVSVESVKLPKLDLTSFSGDRLRWLEFWDSFENAVHKNAKISSIDKFNYLKSKLSGEAKRTIDGLSLSSKNYDVAIKLLKERFGNIQDIIDVHYKGLLNMISPKNTNVSLRIFLDTVERHLRSLESMGESVDQHVFISMIRSKLPSEVLFQLELMKGVENKWSIEILRHCLRQFIESKENSEKIKVTETSESKTSQSSRSSAKPEVPSYQDAIGTLVAAESSSPTSRLPKKCRYCDGAHWSDQCDKYSNIQDRKKQLRGCCFKCLKRGHMSKDCKGSKLCVYCKKSNVHHRSLCDYKFMKLPYTENAKLCEEICDDTSEEIGLLSCGDTVSMQTAVTEVKGSNSPLTEQVRLLLDSGSHRTYISKTLADKLKLKNEGEQTVSLLTFGSDRSKVIKTKSTSLHVKLKNGSFMKLTANIVPTISGVITRHPMHSGVLEKLNNISTNLCLADTLPNKSETDSLDLLIGNDYYLDIIDTEKICVESGLYLLSSKLGWILSGRAKQSTNKVNHEQNMLILPYRHVNDSESMFQEADYAMPRKPDLEDFWNIDSIGITLKEDVINQDDEIAMKNFKDTLKRENGRYQVKWPWRDEVDLPVNRSLALGRLRSLAHRIQKQPELMQRYNDVIQDQLQRDIIERVDSNASEGIKHYIPHHIIVKPHLDTTKVRVVYDASAKARSDCKSLNECLYRGPVLLRDLCGILLRFRLPKIGIVADIEKAFLQIELQKSDRDVTRFLWFKDLNNPSMNENNIQELRFKRVPFGVISSPFILGATIETHLSSYDTGISKQLNENIYMDNVVTGTDTIEEALRLYRDAKQIFNDARMNLRDWITSDKHVNSVIDTSDRTFDTKTKVLGLTWNTVADTLSVQVPAVFCNQIPSTKRNVLKQLASVYDPLGLFAPVTVRGKLLLQRIWSKRLDWDHELDSIDTMEWNDIRADLLKITNHKLKRCISVDNPIQNSLVCFCDASSKAYAAAIYFVQMSEDNTSCNLIFCKTRLAPMKSMTIPRLELLAVLIGVRSINFVRKHLNLKLDSVILMTDSQCVLHWIYSKKKLPVFIENRVSEIRENKDIVFRFIDSKNNPADIASRGCSLPEVSLNSLWWQGPQWILTPIDQWPAHTKIHESDIESMLQISGSDDEIVLKAENSSIEPPFEIKEYNYSSLNKLLRVTAWCQRFVDKIRGNSSENCVLSSNEIQNAEYLWINYIQKLNYSEVFDSIINRKPNNLSRQLGVFVDNCNILRCGGRLKHADLSEAARYPILLPSSGYFTDLIIQKTHTDVLHSGVSQTLSEVRHRFWIPHGRSAVRRNVLKCLICRKSEGGPYKMPLMAPLPKSRVSIATPFSHVGIDYFGPLYVKDNNSTIKSWVCLYTCLVTRAVHLEFVQDMSANSFLLCFRRFIASRGTPEVIISDNAKQFKSSNDAIKRIWGNVIQCNEVQDYSSSKSIKWSFIIELAPWMGGFYERLVGLIKRAIKKTIGRKLLTIQQLTTLLKECEAIVNSRPLVYVGSDLKSSIPISPRHFLCLNPYTGIPDLDIDSQDPDYQPCESSADKLIKIWHKGQNMLNQFWQNWRNEYLLSLRERTQVKLKSARSLAHYVPNIGDVALIKDNVSRGQWKMGKITRLILSHDGEIRSAELYISSGNTIRRPLNLLYPVEVSTSE